jgi:transposase
MSKIKQVLMLHAQGVSNRKIGRELGLYKGTVNSYVQKIRDHGYGIDELLKLDEPVLESKLFAGNPAYKQDRFEEFKVLIPGIEKELSRPHVTRYLLWQEYRESHPDGYGYSQFCFHLDQVINARKPGSIIHYNPAEKLLVDFAGDTVSYVDQLTGEMIETQVFVACLPFSNYTFVMAVPSQRTEDFLHALTCCLNHLGGSPKILVTDNLKSAVIKTDRYEPELNRLMDDLAIHHGLVVIPTRTSKPKDKAPVENEVKIVYRRVYAKLRNHTFFSIDEINRAFAEKTREHNQTRQQQKDYCREEHFLAQGTPGNQLRGEILHHPESLTQQLYLSWQGQALLLGSLPVYRGEGRGGLHPQPGSHICPGKARGNPPAQSKARLYNPERAHGVKSQLLQWPQSRVLHQAGRETLGCVSQALCRDVRTVGIPRDAIPPV